ncbi:tyrosine-type recombinase/integrase [Sphingomonas sanguinis]|uniref:tyrosine-type recombinase/integrase n=1 Tax=Sphingomonas sanguinis TaxID=33051 RepID=UPI001C5A3991|nr:site-specific integrase [Sphingomonas sanguinis]QXT36882.1 tyrosine-type recombinase/integrase [Sphingomonas sanguinis]
MDIKLKGINRTTKRLRDGTKATYFYAWKGGPRLIGEPGSREFLDSYQEATRNRDAPSKDKIRGLLDAFQDSTEFLHLAPRTRADYKKMIAIIDKEYGDFPLAALDDRRTRPEMLAWRDRLAVTSARQADYAWAVLARVFSWALDRGLITAHPARAGGRTYRASRSTNVWTAEDEAAFYAKAPEHLHLALCLALWTGQRQGDLIRLTWGQYDGTHVRLIQSKTVSRVRNSSGKRILIPVGAPLKARLDACPPGPVRQTILLTSRGTPWTENGFRASWNTARAEAGIAGVTFHDLRGTAVTRLALAGATPPEIATVTGHSLKDVNEILDAHYLNRDPRLGESAIRKLESQIATRKTPDPPN